MRTDHAAVEFVLPGVRKVARAGYSKIDELVADACSVVDQTGKTINMLWTIFRGASDFVASRFQPPHRRRLIHLLLAFALVMLV